MADARSSVLLRACGDPYRPSEKFVFLREHLGSSGAPPPRIDLCSVSVSPGYLMAATPINWQSCFGTVRYPVCAKFAEFLEQDPPGAMTFSESKAALFA